MSEKERLRAMKDAFATTKQRCYSESCPDYKYYGGRGITICDRWLESFDNYLADMGLRPEGMTLERVDNDGPYSPENCIWASRAVQGNNTRAVKMITYMGETHSLSEWERRLGFKHGTLKARLGTLGYTVEQAMTKPVKFGGMVPDKEYASMKDQSWRNTSAMLRKPPPLKLNQEQVFAMRLLHSAVAASYSTLARFFGVSIETASDAVQGLKAYRKVVQSELV